jgi:hypothetical protein
MSNTEHRPGAPKYLSVAVVPQATADAAPRRAVVYLLPAESPAVRETASAIQETIIENQGIALDEFKRNPSHHGPVTLIEVQDLATVDRSLTALLDGDPFAAAKADHFEPAELRDYAVRAVGAAFGQRADGFAAILKARTGGLCSVDLRARDWTLYSCNIRPLNHGAVKVGVGLSKI